MDIRTQVLRPARQQAVKLIYRGRTTYDLKLRDTKVTYAIDEPAAEYFFYAYLAFGRLLERPVTNSIVDDLAKSSSFLDIGANLGYYTCIARHFMPADGVIHAIEMDQENFGILGRNIDLNPSSVEAHLHNVAAGAEAGTISYKRLPEISSPILSLHRTEAGKPGSSYTQEMEDRMYDVNVPVVRLDDHLPEGFVPDLVKLDVEGAEFDVLSGMPETLAQLKRMYIEIHPNLLRNAGHSAAEVLDLLRPHFDLFVIPGHRSHSRSDRVEWVPVAEDAEITMNTIVLAIKA